MTIWQKAGWVFGLCLALYVSVASLLADTGQLPLAGWRAGDTRPNIVFIMSDDQDMHLDSLSYMPYLQKHISDQGTFFRRHFCTVALCCPSRASLLTGKAAHNTNVTDINPPYGRSKDEEATIQTHY
jgi:N-acetylglucosamine-6-sulfatase